MSIVSDFARAMANQAFPMLGEEIITIGAVSLSCVLSEVEHGKDFSSGGFENIQRLQAVCRSASMPTTSIIKKSATARGLSFRVESIRKGADFTTITLEQIEKA